MKISIVTAVYNAQDTIGEAVRSVANQRYGNLEHLIIDGLSRDSTLSALDAVSHDRMIVHSEADNGIYDAINKGIARASGDVIGLVHSDDLLAHDGVLERIADAFGDENVEAVYGDLDYVAQGDTRRVIRHWSSGEFNPARLRRGWMPPHPTLYLRRGVFERIGRYNTQFRIAADYDFILRYFSQTKAIPVYLPEVLYTMRMGGVSNRDLSRIIQKSREDLIALRQNRIGGMGTLLTKNVSKLGQFVLRRTTGA